jgi:hypothetical protein
MYGSNLTLFYKMINWKYLFNIKPKFNNYPELRTKYAFTSGGVDYFEFEDPNSLTSGRGFAALNYYKELSMSCTREFLLAHNELIIKSLQPKVGESLNIPAVVKSSMQMTERLEMVIDSLTPYKVASVIFFDKTEDPYSFDYDYAMKKIERWKKEEVGSFFLQVPLKSLIPSSLLSEENIQNYMKVAKEVDKVHYKDISDAISQLLSEKEKSKEWLKKLKLEKSII